MSEAKFTPGPWLLVEYENYCGDICCDIMCADNNQVVCEIPDYHLTRGKIQDSHLISAAPELYEANQYAIDCLGKWLSAALDDDGVCADFKGEILQWMELSSYAARKARGEL